MRKRPQDIHRSAKTPLDGVPEWEYVSSTPKKHSPGHINCLLCEPARAMQPSPISASVLFEVAIDQFLNMRKFRPLPSGHPAGGPHLRRRRRKAALAPNTENSYAQYAESLKLFFTGVPLEKIHCGNMAMYEEARLHGDEPFLRYRRPQDAKSKTLADGTVLPAKGKTPCLAKPKKVNQELSLLRMLLRYAGLWTQELEDNYVPLEEEDSEVPRALTAEQQEHWLHTAASYEDTQVVYWYSLLNFETVNSSDEMRQYRVGDWNMYQRVATVRRGKVRARERTIQIHDADALGAMERLLERARECGATEFQHYIFPFRYRGGEWDPSRPMTSSGIKKAWNLVRERSELTWFRIYDPRHTGITRMAEEGVPIASIKEKAGHVTDKMSRHYTHISEQAQRYWAEEAARRREWRRQSEGARAPRVRTMERKPPAREVGVEYVGPVMQQAR